MGIGEERIMGRVARLCVGLHLEVAMSVRGPLHAGDEHL